MSLIDEALKRARLDAARGEPQERRGPYPWAAAQAGQAAATRRWRRALVTGVLAGSLGAALLGGAAIWLTGRHAAAAVAGAPSAGAPGARLGTVAPAPAPPAGEKAAARAAVEAQPVGGAVAGIAAGSTGSSGQPPAGSEYAASARAELAAAERADRSPNERGGSSSPERADRSPNEHADRSPNEHADRSPNERADRSSTERAGLSSTERAGLSPAEQAGLSPNERVDPDQFAPDPVVSQAPPSPPAARAGATAAGAGEAASSPAAALADGHEYSREVRLPGGGKLALSGIAFSERQPVAVINGKVVGPGEVVSGFTVARILTDRVELRGRGVSIFLLLN